MTAEKVCTTNTESLERGQSKCVNLNSVMQDGLMPNGERLVLGGQVIIEKIGREDGGEYQCWDVTDNTTITTKHVNVLCKLLEIINGQNTWSNII